MPPHGFSTSEKAQCVIWHFEGISNTAIKRKFRTKYAKKPPSRRSIRNWIDQYQTDGDHSHRGGNGRPRVSAERREVIRLMFEEDPRVSLRFVESRTGVSRATIWRFLRQELHLFPYKLQMGSQLSDPDRHARLQYAHNFLANVANDGDYGSKIFYSDECSISLSGGVNKQNCRVWGSERPQVVYEVPQGAESIMVWCAISENGIIGPYFFENESVTGESYYKMLRYFFFPKMRNYGDDYIFQQDGAPPHFALRVRRYLDQKLQTRWIGRAGPTAWPPRSPDLTPCDFFLWGYVKDYVFRELPTTITELKAKIRDAISSISEDTLKNVVKNTEFRIRYLIRQNGAHFENLLN